MEIQIPPYIKGLNADWYKKLVIAFIQTNNSNLKKNIIEQIRVMESKHNTLSPHIDCNLEEWIREEDAKPLPRTPWKINAKNSIKQKRELYNDTINNEEEDYYARFIRRKLLP